MEGVSFVIAAGPESKMDFLRLCEHTETLPELEGRVILQLLERARRHCIAMFPADIDLIERRHDLGVASFFGDSKDLWLSSGWESQLTKLVCTPRKLKATIRRFRWGWQELHGEVDVDELLIASCLRVCAPGAFGFLLRRRAEFSRLGKEADSEPNRTLRNDWESLAGDGFDLGAAESLLEQLVPASRRLFRQDPGESLGRGQFFGSRLRTVYRDRISNERMAPGIRDQEVLRAVFKAKESEQGRGELAKRLFESEEFQDVFEYAQPGLLQGDDFCAVMVRFVSCVKERWGTAASRFTPGLSQMCLISKRAILSPEQQFKFAFDLVKSCIPGNLELATALYSYLCADMPQESLNSMGQEFMVSLKATILAGGWAAFSAGLDDLLPGTLNDLMDMTSGRPRQVPKVIAPKEWNWAAPVLLEGVDNEPSKFVPQISVAIGLSYKHNDLPSEFICNEPILQGIFGVHARELMFKLSKPIVPNPKLDQSKFSIDLSLVPIRAKKWHLANTGANPEPSPIMAGKPEVVGAMTSPQLVQNNPDGDL